MILRCLGFRFVQYSVSIWACVCVCVSAQIIGMAGGKGGVVGWDGGRDYPEGPCKCLHLKALDGHLVVQRLIQCIMGESRVPRNSCLRASQRGRATFSGLNSLGVQPFTLEPSYQKNLSYFDLPCILKWETSLWGWPSHRWTPYCTE